MDNQHTKIKGYRDLSQAEIDLMNKIKSHAQETEALLNEVYAHNCAQFNATRAPEPPEDNPFDSVPPPTKAQLEEYARLTQANPHRWQSIAKTHMQEGFMALVRAVAQPTTF